MHRGLFWLAFVDLRRAWLRSLVTALAIALALIVIVKGAGPFSVDHIWYLHHTAQSSAHERLQGDNYEASHSR